MKVRVFPIAVLLLLLLSVAFSSCDPIPNQIEDSNEHNAADLEGETTTEAESESDDTTTESDSTEESESETMEDTLEDLYPNEPDDGHTKRY